MARLNAEPKVTITQIETLVRERRTQKARLSIARWLSSLTATLDDKIKAADWLRRLDLYREAYLLIAPKKWAPPNASSPQRIHTHYLWVARLLNLMGATQQAYQLVNSVRCQTPEEFRIAANIYLTAYDHSKSYEYFLKSWSLSTVEQKKQYLTRLGILGICDSLSGLGRYTEAVKLAQTIKVEPGEELLQAIVLSAQGEYLAMNKNFLEAKAKLESALNLMPQNTSSVDLAILLKWLAYANGALEKTDVARDIFSDALLALTRSDLRAEAWIECLNLMNRLNLLTIEQQTLLFAYPGLPTKMKLLEGHSQGLSLFEPQARFKIFMARDEYEVDGKKYIGLSKELKLLGILKSSGTRGISSSLVKSLLWPDELSSFLQQTDRISQLLNRLKNEYRIYTKIENGMIQLIEGCEKLILVELCDLPLSPTLFETRQQFTVEEFSDYYNCALSPARRYLENAVELGHLHKTRSKKTVTYSLP